MSKKKKNPAKTVAQHSENTEPMAVESPVVDTESQEPMISVEQAAQMLKLVPVFKQHHLASIHAMCEKYGLPKEGKIDDMKFVLQKYGYSVLK